MAQNKTEDYNKTLHLNRPRTTRSEERECKSFIPLGNLLKRTVST